MSGGRTITRARTDFGCVHGSLYGPLTLELIFSTDLVVPMSGHTMQVEKKNLEFF